MREHFHLISSVLAEYRPNNNPAANTVGDEYARVFESTFDAYFSDDQAVSKFREYLKAIGSSLEEKTVFKQFLIRLLDQLNDDGKTNPINDETAKSITAAIEYELNIDQITPAKQELLRLSYSEEPDTKKSYSHAFEKQVSEIISAKAYQAKFEKYIQGYADNTATDAFIDEAETRVLNPRLVTQFIHNVLNRLIHKRNETIAAIRKAKSAAGAAIIEAEIDDQADQQIGDKKCSVIQAINAELGWQDKLSKPYTPIHKRQNPASAFNTKEYIIEKVILGCSTYGLDDGVNAIDRPIKNGAYASGDPNYDFSKATGGIKIANDIHTGLMYGYFGVTVLSFLIVPARCIYIAATVGWEDALINGKKKMGLKNTLRDRDTIVEFAMNTVVIVLTGLAVFATTFIAWPLIIGLFTVGLFAAVYGAAVTKKSAKDNLVKFHENNENIKILVEDIEWQKQQLRAELGKGHDYSPLQFAKISEEIRIKSNELEKIRSENHNLAINQEYHNSFFGKYGVYIKLGISTATLIAYVLLATAIFSTAAVFTPSLVVMSVLGVAALTYFAVKQYKAYQLEKKKHAAHTTNDTEINELVKSSDKTIVARLGQQNQRNAERQPEEERSLLRSRSGSESEIAQSPRPRRNSFINNVGKLTVNVSRETLAQAADFVAPPQDQKRCSIM